jgi:hypothetical protein
VCVFYIMLFVKLPLGGGGEKLVPCDFFFALMDVPSPAGANNYPKNGLVKRPRRDTRDLSPAGMFRGKAPLRLAAQKSRPHARPQRLCAVRLLTA